MSPTILLLAGALGALAAGRWTAPVEVTHEGKRAIAYRAAVEGGYLIVEALLEPGWHTFVMDNERRANEKLAGKQSLGVDQQTEIAVSGGLAAAGGWLQSPPKDFSKPDLRWYSWGFENRALFAVKVRRTGSAPAQLAIRGQACTETVCKNIDVALTVPAGAGGSGSPPVDLKTLTPVR
jgi:hypothetical protein